MRSTKFAALALCVFGLAGCGSREAIVTVQPPKNPAPVTGAVVYRGKPVTGVRVTFHPQFESGAGFATTGETDKDGKFALGTGVPGNGAPPGEYLVTLEKPRIESERKTGLEIEVDEWKGKYADPLKSIWRVTVKEGENALDPFKLD